MKKLKVLWCRIPRPCRGLLNLAGIALLVFLLYTSIGGTPLSRAHAFRRAERANFVGPSKILFNETLEGMYYNHVLVAASDYGVSTYIHHMHNGKPNGEYNYFPKTGSVTVVSVPTNYNFYGTNGGLGGLPVYVVDDYPEAKYAELEIAVTGTFPIRYNEENKRISLNHHFSSNAHREHSGIFAFAITLTDPSYGPDCSVYSSQGYALDALAWTFSKWGRSMVEETKIVATVRLYDKNENLIIEQELLLKYPVS